MDMVVFHSWWTVALLVTFIGIVIWAWSGKRRAEFECAARMPLDDDEPLAAKGAGHAPAAESEGNKNG